MLHTQVHSNFIFSVMAHASPCKLGTYEQGHSRQWILSLAPWAVLFIVIQVYAWNYNAYCCCSLIHSLRLCCCGRALFQYNFIFLALKWSKVLSFQQALEEIYGRERQNCRSRYNYGSAFKPGLGFVCLNTI